MQTNISFRFRFDFVFPPRKIRLKWHWDYPSYCFSWYGRSKKAQEKTTTANHRFPLLIRHHGKTKTTPIDVLLFLKISKFLKVIAGVKRKTKLTERISVSSIDAQCSTVNHRRTFAYSWKGVITVRENNNNKFLWFFQ